MHISSATHRAFVLTAVATCLGAMVVVTVGLPLVAPQQATALDYRHLALRSSVPEADARVGSAVAEVRLFFTEAPQMEGTSVRIVDSNEELVPAADAAADEGDTKQVFVQLERPLSAGSYTVLWRTMAQDGHVLRGDFGFQVTTE